MANEKIFYRKCPICQGYDGEVLHTIKMNLPQEFRLPEIYDVVCCKDCGFVFADTKANTNDYKYYYENCNLYSDMGRVKKGLYDETYQCDIERIMMYCNKEEKILDIGCGNGGILKLLLENGYQHLFGIDPSFESIRYLESEGIKGEVGDIYSEVPMSFFHKFDFVICTAVLEHLLDLGVAIEHIKKLLKTEGRVYITVPGIEGFSIYKNLIPDYFNHEHINYFNEYALEYIMSMYGFEKINMQIDSNYLVKSSPPEFVLSAIYKYTGVKKVLKRNDIAKKQIVKYFEYNSQREKKIEEDIHRIANGKQKIVVWGTGASTMWLLNGNLGIQQKIEYFVDNNCLKTQKEMFGKKTYLPNKLHEDKKAIIIICVMTNSFEILEQMKQLGIENEYYILGQ